MGASRVVSLPRTRIGVRRPSSSTVPIVRPSIWVRSELEIASTVKPRRPASMRFTDNRIILRALVERGVDILGAVDAGQNGRQLAGDLVELCDVRPENLHRDIAAHAADHLKFSCALLLQRHGFCSRREVFSCRGRRVSSRSPVRFPEWLTDHPDGTPLLGQVRHFLS